MFSNIFDLNRKILPCFKREQENFRAKNSWTLGFVDSEFVKTCHMIDVCLNDIADNFFAYKQSIVNFDCVLSKDSEQSICFLGKTIVNIS